MEIIDFHTHIFPDPIAHKATDSIRDFYRIDGDHMDGTAETLLKKHQQAGISRQVILPVAIHANQVSHINNFVLEQAACHSSFIPFGALHAGMDHPEKELERILAAGVKGVKLHPDFSRFPIDDLRLFPMYEAVRGRLPLLIHMGDDRYNYSHPIRLRRILELFPGLQVIAAHFGGHTMYDVAYTHLHDTSCFFDISSCLMFMDKATAKQYISMYGAERLVFGTDYPLWDPVNEVQRFMELDLPEKQAAQIANKTARHILKL